MRRTRSGKKTGTQKKWIPILIAVFAVFVVSVVILNGINASKVNEQKEHIEKLEQRNLELENQIKQVQEELEKERNASVIYLSFDDGPNKNTAAILDALDNHGVKATFFVTGQQSDYFPLFNDILERGHSLGIHTNTHAYNQVYANIENYKADFNAIESSVMAVTGQQPEVYRFPGGSGSANSYGLLQPAEAFLAEKGYAYFDWNVDSSDWRIRNGRQIADGIMANLTNEKNNHILLHDLYDFNIETINIIIPQLKERGYVFRTYKKESPAIRFFQ